MGKGIDLAAFDSPIHAAVLEELRDQLLIAFLLKLGGKVDLTVAEVDATGGYLMGFSFEMQKPTGVAALDAQITGVFHFDLKQKQ